jgi:hypothetical protein
VGNFGLRIHWFHVYFVYSWGGVTLNPLGTSATIGSVVPAPADDGRGAVGGMRIGKVNRST